MEGVGPNSFVTILWGSYPCWRFQTIIKFSHNTKVVGLITDNDGTAYREVVRDLAVWCQDNNLSLNVIKTKEMIVDYKERRTEHAPILINGCSVAG